MDSRFSRKTITKDFEAPWCISTKGKYYFPIQREIHNICYNGRVHTDHSLTRVILNRLRRWTNHHSIIELNGK
jgi:hypothetical protein